MKLAIMQPYFLPYVGYWQLMNAVDEFIVYDDIQYVKEGWINRNRILVNGGDDYITIPLKKAPVALDICDRYLAESWTAERFTLFNRISAAYRKAPCFAAVLPLVREILHYDEDNLFEFLLHSLYVVKNYLEINTPFVISSMVGVGHWLKSKNKVLAICKARGAVTYYNPIGGVNLYDRMEFKAAGIDLHFLRARNFHYKQFDHAFVSSLSILDVMMFNPAERVREYLEYYELE
jgi:hypothetical protein